MSEQIPFPEKIISWFDIVKGIGEVALHFITDQVHYKPPTHGNHFIQQESHGDSAP